MYVRVNAGLAALSFTGSHAVSELGLSAKGRALGSLGQRLDARCNVTARDACLCVDGCELALMDGRCSSQMLILR